MKRGINMIKLATIGTSWITEQFIAACQATQLYEITKIYSRTLKKAQDFAEKVGEGRGVATFEELFEADVEVVYIASPNALHYQQAKMMLEHGKHVIIEKPQVDNLRQWHDLHQYAKSHHLFIFDAVRHIHTENFRYLKQLVESQRSASTYPFLGASFTLGQYSSKYDSYVEAMEKHETGPNIFNPEFSGGSLRDLGVYPLYVALGLFGKPQTVHYHAVNGSNGIDVFGNLILHYGAFMVTILVSKGVHSRQANEIYIQDKTIDISHISELSTIRLLSRDGEIMDQFHQASENPMIDEAKFFATTLANKIFTEEYLAFETLNCQVMEIIDQIMP